MGVDGFVTLQGWDCCRIVAVLRKDLRTVARIRADIAEAEGVAVGRVRVWVAVIELAPPSTAATVAMLRNRWQRLLSLDDVDEDEDAAAAVDTFKRLRAAGVRLPKAEAEAMVRWCGAAVMDDPNSVEWIGGAA